MTDINGVAKNMPRPSEGIQEEGPMGEQLELGITAPSQAMPPLIDIAARAIAPEPRRRESPERLLRTREEHLRIALAATRAGTWEHDLVNGTYVCSEACKANLGLASDEELTYEGMFDVVHEDDRRRVRDAARQAITHGTDYEIEYRVKWRDGSLHWLLARGIALRGRGGHPERLIGVMMDVTHRKHADLLLLESEQRFRTLAEAMPQLVWMSTPAGHIDYLNQRWRDYVGSDPSALYGWNWHGLLHPDEARHVVGVWRIHMDSGQPLEIKHRLRHRSGEYRWHLVRGVALRDDSGQIVRWVGTCTEVHELELRERAARFLNRLDLALARMADADDIAAEAVERLGRYLDVDVCALVTVDPDTGTARCCRAWRSDRAAGSWPMHTFPDSVCGRLRAGEIVAVQDAARETRLEGIAERCADDHMRAFIVAPRLAEGRWIGALVVGVQQPRDWRVEEIQLLRDVHARTWPVVERARAEAAVRRANQRFERAEEAAGGFVYEWDQAAGDGACSDGVHRLLGYAASELVPHSAQWREAIHPDDVERFDREISRAVEQCATYALEYRVRHAVGHYVDIWERGRAAFSRPGKALLTGSIVDFTARRLAEAQVAHLLAEEQSARAIAETASRLKDEFLATVSHELRTPLHAISGWAHVLARAELTREDQARAVDAILRNAKAQNRIIEDILDVSRIITGKLKLDLQQVDLVAVVESALDTVRPTAAAKKIRVETRMERARLPVLGDAARLQQAAWNVLMNALKFTPSGGSVTIDLRESGGNATLTIADTGIGISADFLPHVFERFRQADGSITRRHGGLGLGLALVRHIVEMHGGSVQADSAGEGQGATFVLTIPVAVAAQLQPSVASWHSVREDEARIPAARVDGLRVLVVDDEPDVLELVAKILADAGAQVSTSNSAQGALDLMNSHPFDLLILDIAMPDTDGYALMREIRSRQVAQGGSVPAIALTACAHAEERARAFAAGFQCHLAKPIEPPALVSAVATLSHRGTEH